MAGQGPAEEGAGGDPGSTHERMNHLELELADLLLINKTDLVTEEQLGAVTSFLGKVNPTAEVVRTEHSVVEPKALLATARFSMEKAEEHPQWLQEAREHEVRSDASRTHSASSQRATHATS